MVVSRIGLFGGGRGTRLKTEGLTFVFISHVSTQRLGPTDPSRRSACMLASYNWCL
jgi:hypothetical protein